MTQAAKKRKKAVNDSDWQCEYESQIACYFDEQNR